MYCRHGVEPVRKVHLNEDVMAANLSNLYISHPRPKVCRQELWFCVISTWCRWLGATSDGTWRRRPT